MIIKIPIVLDHFRDATKMLYTHLTRPSALGPRPRALPSLLLLLMLSASCVRTEVLNEVVPMTHHTKQHDTTIITPPADTARVPITFDPSVEDWHETHVEVEE